MITGWAHDNLDLEDRTGNVRVSATFDYESMYFTIGQNRGRLGDYIQTILGAAPDNLGSAPRKDGIARDGRQSPLNQPVNAGNSNAFELPTNEGLDFFPGEDALIRQGALAGSGLMGDNTSVAANALSEQLASPAGLNSPAKKLEQTLMDVGADLENQSFSQAAAQTFPLGTETILSPLNPTLVEPLSTKQLNPEIPASFKGKERLLVKSTNEANRILEDSQGRDLTQSERKTLSAYKGRSGELLAAMQRQVAADKAKAQSSSATSSALANTKAKFT
jgi:hypothetical protein